MNTNHRFATAFVLLAAGIIPACSSFGGDGGSQPKPADPAQGGGDGGDGPKAKPVEGTPDASDLNETLGVFVAPNGRPNAEGTREHPLLAVQAGIDLGKKLGKRVYVCTGTYREVLTIADSISVIGGLYCSGNTWRLGAPRSRIESPTSPAIIANDVVSPTRLEGLDVVAPNATGPSTSSIGMQAVRSPGIAIASSKVTAGDGADGANGTNGVQLGQQGAVNGTSSLPAAMCVKGDTCAQFGFDGEWAANSAPGGTSVCAGAAGHDGLPGGFGGPASLWAPIFEAVSHTFIWSRYKDLVYGESKPGTAGADAADGPVGSPFGTFGEGGYLPAAGNAGTDGAPGNGGRGGRGSDGNGLPAAGSAVGTVWRAVSGDAGGAGGCPGLAGTPGTGGGGSIALALVESPLTVDGSELVSAKGGAAGRGVFGSEPTAGGTAGASWSADPTFTGRSGGRGGLAGVSTNGSSGPSLGVIHTGAAPKILGTTRITPGPGGTSIPAQVRTDALGNTKTIPGTAAGLSEAVHAL